MNSQWIKDFIFIASSPPPVATGLMQRTHGGTLQPINRKPKYRKQQNPYFKSEHKFSEENVLKLLFSFLIWKLNNE